MRLESGVTHGAARGPPTMDLRKGSMSPLYHLKGHRKVIERSSNGFGVSALSFVRLLSFRILATSKVISR